MIYVVQITTFDYGSFEGVSIGHHTYNTFFTSKAKAQELVDELESYKCKKSVMRQEYFIQTLWPADEAPRIVVA